VSGSFTQQLSIVVDQVGTSAAITNVSSGPIWKWHFLSGGQYTSVPGGPMVQDPAHSCLDRLSAGARGRRSGLPPVRKGIAIIL
jgi:hypothetical protein